MTDAAIHRISRKANGFVSSLTGSQWIATGYALAMTRWGKDALAMTRSGEDAVCGEECSVRVDNHTHFLSLRGGRASDRRGNPSCLERMRSTCLFAYWITVDRHGLSALAMTRWGNKGCTTPSGSQGG